MAGWRDPDKPYWGNRLLKELDERTREPYCSYCTDGIRPEDDSKLCGLTGCDPGDECDQPCCIGPEAA